MAFFENLGQNLSNMGAAASQKAKDVTEMQKLKSAVSTEEKKITEYYNAIGKKFFEANVDNAPDEYVNFINNIKESMALIEDYKKQMAALKKTVTCPGCGNEVDKTSAFCNKCGYNMKDVIAEANAGAAGTNANVCPGCGNTYSEGAKFCNSCGFKLQ
ncbi:MAG: zinc ribbon domain-containing protein [Lachnospiraceae bacterium]|nr:zinc ribbon domain-containing protein [Lachnospiraceae bacterium]